MFESCWEATLPADPEARHPLRGDVKTEALIIGGGLAGILCAYRLQERGLDCIVLEGRRAGSGVTGHTTGKVTAQHGLVYGSLLQSLGQERAALYCALHQEAVQDLRKLAAGVLCDFEDKTAYTYTLRDPKKLEQEQAAYERLSIPHVMQERPPLPFSTAGALGMTGQAQFHPLKLLRGLARSLTLYEGSFVHSLQNNIAYTETGTVKAEHIVLATHFPLVNIPGAYFLKQYQSRSYVIALENAQDMGGMYVDDQPAGHSFRNYQNLLFLGGGDHRTGLKGGGFAELRGLAQKAYPAARERYAWATQDCMPLDNLPYIGNHRKSARNVYVATGFRKWGMTGAMVAANVLSDLILQGQSRDRGLFSPQRSMGKPQLAENIVFAGAGLLSFGKRCSHMGCALRWNAIENSYDCPCHGSRFSEKGEVLEGPAKRRIQP